jgi:hypothetical protein
MTIEGPQPYRVVLSGLVQDQLRELVQAAIREGRGAEVVRAAQSLQSALMWTPEVVAEPVLDLPPLGRVQVGSFGPIQLRFAVNDDRLLVFVAWWRLLPTDAA